MNATQIPPTAPVAVADAPGDAPTPDARARLFELVGGRRGIVDGGLPPLVFVATNAVVGGHLARPTALAVAIGAAGGVGLGLVGVRLLRKEPLRRVVGGLVGLTIAVVFALGSGEARSFFLPGIYVDAAYALVLGGSVLLGRPLVGTAWGLLQRSRLEWRADARLRRRFAIATLGWALVYATRALVQAGLYVDDRPGLLAAAKLLLGWPLTALALALTLAFIRGLSGTVDASART